MPRIKRIEVKPGETVVYSETMKDSAGNTLNLAGASGTCSVVETLGGTSLGSGTLDFTDGANGIVETTIPASITANFTVGDVYYFDSKITESSGSILYTPTVEMLAIGKAT